MKKHTAFTFILLFILLVNSKGFSALDITVKNREGKPAVANVQIFPGEISPDSDKEPVPPPVQRADGLVGFKTNADGKVRVEVPPGEYTVVVFSEMDEHRFSLVKRVAAPGSIELSAERASAVTIFATNDEDEPLEGANIFFRPSRRVRGFIGSTDNDGYRLAYVSPGTYHTVLISSGDRYYLVLPNQKVDLPDTRINIEAANLATVKVDFDLPEFYIFPAIYEVLETNLTYEKIEAIEEEVGYDATYTNEFSLIPGTATLGANLTYWFNIEFVGKSFYAYEIRTSPILLKDGTYHIGSTGKEKFDIEVLFDKQEYHPGETITVRYEFLDDRKNRLNRLFDYSGARLIFPFVTVRNPDGVQIASNPHTDDFSGFTFNLPPSANVGKYRLRIYLDAKSYGKITKAVTFDVISHPDEKPKISQIAVPKEAEAGSEIIFSADIEDDKVLDRVTLILSHEDGQKQSFQTPGNQQKISFRADIPDEFALPGKLRWDILAKDATGNETTLSGQILIRDSNAPIIEHQPIETTEIGVDVILEAQITDNACVSDVRLSYFVLNDGVHPFKTNYKFNDGNLQTVKFERTDLQYRTTIPAIKQFGVMSYFIQSTDGAENVGYFPEKGKFVTTQIVDTTPPMIYHRKAEICLERGYTHAQDRDCRSGNNLLTIDAVVDDNNAVEDVKLYYKSPGADKFIESAMVLTGNVYQATILASDFPAGVEYFIEAFDKPDHNNTSRKTRFPAGAFLYQPPDGLPLEVELLPRSSSESPLEIEVGTSQLFAIQDKAGNPVKAVWALTGSIGYIDQTGLFTAEKQIRGGSSGQVLFLDQPNEVREGFGRIIVTVVETTAYLMHLDQTLPLQATAYVRLKPGQPSRIALVPQFARVSAGNSQYFHAVLMDDVDNEISNGSLQWRVSGDVGEIDVGMFGAKKVGFGAVEVLFENLRAVSEVRVDMAKIERISISPQNAKIKSGKTRSLRRLDTTLWATPSPSRPSGRFRGVSEGLKMAPLRVAKLEMER